MTEPPPNKNDDVEFSRLVESGPLGYVAMDARGTITRVNETMLRWLQYERGDLVGARSFQQLLAPGGRIYFDTHLRPMLHVQREVNEVAVELVRADRSRLPVLVNFVRRTDAGNEDVGMEAIVFVASERRRYEEELLAERQRAERAGARLQTLHDVVTGLAATSTIDEVVHVITERTLRTIDGALCSVWLLEPDLRAAVWSGGDSDDDRSSTPRVSFPEGGTALDELSGGQLVVISDRDAAADTYPLICGWLVESGRRSAVIAPLISDGRLMGILSYGFAQLHEFDDDECRSVGALAVQAQQAIARAHALEAERRARDRLESVFRFATRLSKSLQLDTVIEAIVDSSIRLLGASGVHLTTVGDARSAMRFDREHEPGAEAVSPPLVGANTISSAAIRTGEVVIASSRAEVEASYPDSPILVEPEFGRVIAAPLFSGRKVVGAWVLAFADEGLPDEDDEKIVRLFSQQAALAIRRAIRHEAESTARRRADVGRHISEALNRAVTTDDVGHALIGEGSNPFDADGLALFAVTDDGLSFELVAKAGQANGLTSATTRLSSTSPAIANALESKQSLFVESEPAVRSALTGLIDDGEWSSAAILPLTSSGETLGLVVAVFEHDQELSSDGRLALSAMAAEASIALGRARLYELERNVAETLQQSLVPRIVPIPGWHIDTVYIPGSQHLVVGGDLFDVTTFDDGRLVIVVGDVVGHGLRAAASMGHLRNAAKALALVMSTPEEMLESLDEFALLTPGVKYSSLCCVMIGNDGEGRYACAGHPYPVFARADGSVELFEEGRSPLLGIDNDGRSGAAFSMDEASTLVVVTDGLIERRSTPIDKGIDQLVTCVANVDFATPSDHAREIADAVLGDTAPDDDVVVVCLTRRHERHRNAAVAAQSSSL